MCDFNRLTGEHARNRVYRGRRFSTASLLQIASRLFHPSAVPSRGDVELFIITPVGTTGGINARNGFSVPCPGCVDHACNARTSRRVLLRARYLRQNANLARNLSLSGGNVSLILNPGNFESWHGTTGVACLNKNGTIKKRKLKNQRRNTCKCFSGLSSFSCYDTCNSNAPRESCLSLGNPSGIAARQEIEARHARCGVAEKSLQKRTVKEYLRVVLNVLLCIYFVLYY